MAADFAAIISFRGEISVDALFFFFILGNYREIFPTKGAAAVMLGWPRRTTLSVWKGRLSEGLCCIRRFWSG
jgi:hypothetical protein